MEEGERAMLQEHLQNTYQYLFDVAHEALLAGGSFVPFGAGIRKTGEQIVTNVDLPRDASGPNDHISGLIAGFRLDDEQNGLIACGLVFDGQMTQSGQAHAKALCFHLEAANGQAVEVMAPYERLPDGAVTFQDPQVTPVHAEIFINAAEQF